MFKGYLKDFKKFPFCDILFLWPFLIIFSVGVCKGVYVYFDSHQSNVRAKIVDLRLITQTTSVKENGNEEGHPIAGAILGGAVAGPLGLIAGGILGSEVGKDPINTTPQTLTTIEGCSVTTKVESDDVLFKDYIRSGRLCSVLKHEDLIMLKKTVRKSNNSHFYAFDINDNPGLLY